MKLTHALLGAAALMSASIGIAQAQPDWVPPGNDGRGYYSEFDRNGYYDRDGRYQRIQGGRPGRGFGRGNRIAHAMSARKRRQQSRVGVNDAIWEFTEESWAEHTHESSTNNQVGIVRTHQISEGKVPVVA